ncbi:MAG TPA: hypothetical protein VL689_14690 [Paraburkholderia sp.]|jgi:hypothetical protein|nr:hypothetical protein [Paraburkholderia sp.]
MNTPETSSARPRPPLALRLYTWAGIVGVPAVWTLHLLASAMLITTACAGGVVQRNALSWPVVETAVRTLSALAFALALVCTLLAWRAWRAAADAAHAYAPVNAASSNGEAGDHGKHRFLALSGAMVSAGFTVALMFTASVIVAASPSQLCAPFR